MVANEYVIPRSRCQRENNIRVYAASCNQCGLEVVVVVVIIIIAPARCSLVNSPTAWPGVQRKRIEMVRPGNNQRTEDTPAGGEWVPDPRERLLEDGMPSVLASRRGVNTGQIALSRGGSMGERWQYVEGLSNNSSDI
jgi:hypothetical protein